MLTLRTMLKDSALALLVLATGAGLYGGWSWAGSALTGGLLAMGNLWLISQVVARGFSQHDVSGKGAAFFAVGLVLKTVVGLGLLFLLLNFLPAIPVMVGVLSVVSAIGVRNIVDLASLPTEQEI